MNYERLYEHRFNNVDQESRTKVWGAIAPYLHTRLGKPDRVLDPAAGRCEFINAVPARERWAVDQVPYQGVELQPGTHFVVSDIMEAELPADHFGGALVSNFLEHLPTVEAIYEFLTRLHGWMAPGGKVAILGPNYRYCSRTYWDFADHSLALTHIAIQEHLYTAGFTPIETNPQFLPFSFTGRLPASQSLTNLYLRTPVAWRFLGKQFLVIGEK